MWICLASAWGVLLQIWGTGSGFPLGGRRLRPCTKALPGAALPQWQVSPAVRAWHAAHPGPKPTTAILPVKLQCGLWVKEWTAYSKSNPALPSVLHHAVTLAWIYWERQGAVQKSRSSAASQLAWATCVLVCMCMLLDEEHSPSLWQHSVPALHTWAPKTCKQ